MVGWFDFFLIKGVLLEGMSTSGFCTGASFNDFGCRLQESVGVIHGLYPRFRPAAVASWRFQSQQFELDLFVACFAEMTVAHLTHLIVRDVWNFCHFESIYCNLYH